jgi:ubiquinone/menaquinone biosynthesis C-methylase UbiE|tara:strand:+ start:216 stop:836 length:621 start_codon:yes stop_codon:yes gene_type:complete
MVWSKYIQPRLISLACSGKPFRIQRTKIVPLAIGNVLEIGLGSGHNLPYYNLDKVDKITGVEPSEEMQKLAVNRIINMELDVNLITSDAADIPIDDNSIDTIVCTYTLCTVSRPLEVLQEMKRVLKKGGKFLFSEHGQSPEINIRRFQKRIEPIWKILADGCHLTRDIKDLLDESGFIIDSLETMYLPKTPRFVGYNYWGSAKSIS